MRYLLIIGFIVHFGLFRSTAQTGSACVGSLEFLTSDDAVHLPTSAGLQYYSSNGFTWECWIKLTTPFSSYSGSLLRPIICSIDPVPYEDICLSFGWSGGVGNVASTHLCFKVDGPNSGTGFSNVSCDYYPAGGFVLGTWYHVAATMDYANHVSKLYLNGALVDTKTVNSGPMVRVIPSQLSWDVALNPGYSNPPLGGNMDEVRVWKRVRTPAEIATYYNQCLAGNEQDLVVYYRCNQSTGATATDATSNALNGPLVNGAAWSTQQPTLVGSYCTIGCCPAFAVGNDTTICPGIATQLTSSGGFTSYSWTPSTGLNNNNIQNPIASPTVTTNYVVTASYIDTSSGQVCTSKDSIKVIVNNSLTLFTPDYSVCVGQPLAVVPVVTGGSGNYTYDWGNGYSGATYVTTPAADSTYSVMVTDINGCTIGYSSGSITVLPPLNASVNGISTCTGDTITLTAIVAGGNGNYSFTWTPSNGHSNPLSILAPTSSTVYTLVVSDGCSLVNATDTANVFITQAPTISLPAPVSGCPPVCIDLSNVPYTNLSGWMWNYGDGTHSNSQNGTYCYSKSGSYNISLSYTTNLGCLKTVASSSIVTVFPVPVAAFTPSISETDMLNPQIQFYNQSTNCASSQWTFGDLSSSALQNPSHTYTAPGIYPVTLVVESSKGCVDSVTHEIIVYDIFTFYAPNAFSPNSDGNNDVFLPQGSGWQEGTFKMVVYDRWGALIESTTDPYRGWDGKMKGGEAQEDTYVWKVEVKDNFKKPYLYSGIITLIR